MTYPNNCPHCDYLMDIGDVYEVLKERYGEEKAFDWASLHGWSAENPTRFSNIVAIYDNALDMTTHYICPQCRKTIEVT